MRASQRRRSFQGETMRETRAFRPSAEGLEPRIALSTLTVAGRHATSAVFRSVPGQVDHAPLNRQVLALASSRRPAKANPATVGSWTPPKLFKPPNATNTYVAIDASVLPDGTLVTWGHDYEGFIRNKKASEGTPSVMVWDPKTNSYEKHNTDWINLFCGGHAFLPDGRLVVAGGHGPAEVPVRGLQTAFGHNKVAAYDFRTHSWSRLPNMRAGRYYPSAITLADGSILVASGDDQFGRPNVIPEIYRDGQGWTSLTGARMTHSAQWYPNMYQLSNGVVFGSLPGPRTFFIDPGGQGRFWSGPKLSLRRYEGTSVMYAPDKILAVGGNTGAFNTNSAETIDLSQANARWQKTAPMRVARGFPNATLLPDGTVLVTGGSNAAGGAANPAELWNPQTGRWTTLASLTTPRLYHSIGILLPDARVLVAGGGQDTTADHQDMQVFSPPYLFRGNRPVITSAFDTATYDATVNLNTPDASSISRVTLVKLGSVTHSFNMTQRIAEVSFDHTDSQTLSLHIPSNPNLLPPGYYMLFILDAGGTPSVSKIVQIVGK